MGSIKEIQITLWKGKFGFTVLHYDVTAWLVKNYIC